jgi:hypothetical protein
MAMIRRVWVAALVMCGTLVAPTGLVSADASDDYPIPHWILKTTCTVDQYMAAVRDVGPVYYQRYMIDYNNRPPDIRQGARDRIYWFFSLDYQGDEDVGPGARPNPLGMHVVGILAVEDRIRVRDLPVVQNLTSR